MTKKETRSQRTDRLGWVVTERYTTNPHLGTRLLGPVKKGVPLRSNLPELYPTRAKAQRAAKGIVMHSPSQVVAVRQLGQTSNSTIRLLK